KMSECANRICIGTNSWLREWKEEEGCRRALRIGELHPWIWTEWLQRTIELKNKNCTPWHPLMSLDSKRPATDQEMEDAIRAYSNISGDATKALVERSHEILCTVLNGFPTYATRWD